MIRIRMLISGGQFSTSRFGTPRRTNVLREVLAFSVDGK